MPGVSPTTPYTHLRVFSKRRDHVPVKRVERLGAVQLVDARGTNRLVQHLVGVFVERDADLLAPRIGSHDRRGRGHVSLDGGEAERSARRGHAQTRCYSVENGHSAGGVETQEMGSRAPVIVEWRRARQR